MSAAPFFIVSSGRSGTAMLHKALSAVPGVEMHHEYMVHIVQPLAVRRAMGLAGTGEAQSVLHATHGAAVHYSEAHHWGDSSNKLSWLIPELAALFPNARFVHLVRDGRKVAGSYYRKLWRECYDNRSTAILQTHVEDPANHPAPPPEKKYWWPLPRKTDPLAQPFRNFDQFQRIAWHWAEINRVILDCLSRVDDARKHFVRLEDLHACPETSRTLYRFLNLDYQDENFLLFKRPHNVNTPEDKLLSDAQRAQFETIAGAVMLELGYADRVEYAMNY